MTRADPTTMGNSGGPIVLDQDGPEIYATIFTIAPSRRDSSTIWTGSDDGLVHVTRNGGMTWRNVTPPDLPPNTRVSRIDASPHRPGSAYVAAERHQMDDRTPYVWKTEDYGVRWTRITNGIPGDDFVRVVREDRVREGLLFAGTEHGVYVSFDQGGHWRSLSQNLPDVQVSDLVVESRDVVIATHGRSFWVLDNIAPLRQITVDMLAGTERRGARLLVPAGAVRRVHPADVDFFLGAAADSVRIDVVDGDGGLVRSLGLGTRGPGLHRATWDLRYSGATVFPGIVLEGGDPRRGMWAPPGRYTVRLTVGAGGATTAAETQALLITKDPRLSKVTDDDLRAQFRLARRIRDRESASNEAVIRIRATRQLLQGRMMRDTLGMARAHIDDLLGAAAPLERALDEVEGEIYQVKNQRPKDKIAFPIRLNDRLTGLRSIVESGDARPTAAQEHVFRELAGALDVKLGHLEMAMRRDFVSLNDARRAAGLGPLVIPGAAARAPTPNDPPSAPSTAAR